jgi:hypothetical protein
MSYETRSVIRVLGHDAVNVRLFDNRFLDCLFLDSRFLYKFCNHNFLQDIVPDIDCCRAGSGSEYPGLIREIQALGLNRCAR